MTTNERIEYFKEDCKTVINKFRTTLFYYDSEKNGDFRAFATSEASNKTKIISALHCAALGMLDEVDFKSVWAFLDISNSTFAIIDEDMKHTNTYCEFVDYLETKQN